MEGQAILSERYEDNKIAAEWGRRQAELIRKGEEITKELTEKYTAIIKTQMEREKEKRK